MKSLLNPAEFEEVILRLENCTPQSKAVWGKMDVAQMLAHCSNTFEVATGEKILKRSLLGYLFGGMVKKKWLGNMDPFEHNSPTDPYFKMVDSKAFEKEKARLKSYIEKFHRGGKEKVTTSTHSFFGYLSAEEWGVLMYKHLDHHFRQFSA
jgi:hypothetical protein